MKMENRKWKLEGEEVGVRGRSQINKSKEASEKQPDPFCRNRRKLGPPRAVFVDRGGNREPFIDFTKSENRTRMQEGNT